MMLKIIAEEEGGHNQVSEDQSAQEEGVNK